MIFILSTAHIIFIYSYHKFLFYVNNIVITSYFTSFNSVFMVSLYILKVKKGFIPKIKVKQHIYQYVERLPINPIVVGFQSRFKISFMMQPNTFDKSNSGKRFVKSINPVQHLFAGKCQKKRVIQITKFCSVFTELEQKSEC